MLNNQPIQVTLADDIGMVSAAPDPAEEPPAPKAGEEVVQPDDSEIAPPDPEPEPAKPKPKPEPAKPAPAPTAPKPRTPPTTATKPPTQSRPGRQVSEGFRNLDVSGPADTRTPGRGDRSQASATGAEQANFLSAVKRQVQPCADRQTIPSAEAESIVAIVQLRLKRDGSLDSVRILRHEGVNGANQRYVTRVDDAVEAVFKGCTPLRGLPADLYDVKGGWKSLTFRYQLSS